MTTVLELLEPIPGDAPCGEDLRYDPDFDELRELRREEDANAPQGVWETATKRAEWGKVASHAEHLLKTRTKDLQIAVWLTEAWFMADGLDGFVRGMDLIAGLVGHFWDGLYPPIEEGDVEGRVAPLFWLDEKMPQRLMTVPLTQNQAIEDSQAYSWQSYANARRIEAALQARTRESESYRGDVTVTKIMAAARATPLPFLEGRRRGFGDCVEGLERLAAAIDARAGEEGPSFSKLRQSLSDILSLVDRVLADRGVVRAPQPPALAYGADAADAPAPAPAPAKPKLGPFARMFGGGDKTPTAGRSAMPQDKSEIQSREEAYHLLSVAAQYLMEAEPHSPAPYLVMRAVSWGSMDLAELLRELLAEGDGRQLFKLLKIPAQRPRGGDDDD